MAESPAAVCASHRGRGLLRRPSRQASSHSYGTGLAADAVDAGAGLPAMGGKAAPNGGALYIHGTAHPLPK